MQLAGAKLFKAMAFAFGVVTGAQVGASLAHAQQFEIPASAKAAIIEATNAYRQTKGLAPLSENEGASREAHAYANYLAQTMKRGHSADGRDPVQRLRAGGVKFCKFRGENWHESWTRPARASPDVAMGAAMRFWKTWQSMVLPGDPGVYRHLVPQRHANRIQCCGGARRNAATA
jgi:Cysteine-rich secretory protein family